MKQIMPANQTTGKNSSITNLRFNFSYQISFQHCNVHKSLVKFEISVRLLHIGSVTLLKIFRKYNVAILPYSMHTGFLAYSRNLQKVAMSSYLTKYHTQYRLKLFGVLKNVTTLEGKLSKKDTNLSSTDLIWPRNIVFQIDLITQVHLCGANLQMTQFMMIIKPWSLIKQNLLRQVHVHSGISVE